MYFQTLSLLALAAAPAVLADRCTFIGWTEIHMNVGGATGSAFGSAGAPDTGFELYYVGGQHIASTGGNSIDIKGTTVPGSELKLPHDVQWTPSSGFLTIDGCSIEYNGQKVTGYTKGPIKPCNSGVSGFGVGTCSYCSADFDCPSNLA